MLTACSLESFAKYQLCIPNCPLYLQQPKQICALAGFCTADMKKSTPMVKLEAAKMVPAAKVVPALELFPATKMEPAADKSAKVSWDWHLIPDSYQHLIVI